MHFLTSTAIAFHDSVVFCLATVIMLTDYGVNHVIVLTIRTDDGRLRRHNLAYK